MITVRDVSYSYPGAGTTPRGYPVRRAVEGASLDIRPGEVIAVVGHNGSGKSTLARLLSAQILPSSGEVSVDGLVTRSVPAAEIRRRVSVVWQNPDNQLVCGVVESDVAFGPENLGLPEAEIDRRVEDVLTRVGLQSIRHVSTDRLTSGQKQLVAVAGVLALEPGYLILDEATARLDPASADAVLEAVLRWARAEGTGAARRDAAGVVVITHRLSEVLRADWLCHMSDGRIVAYDRPDRILRRARFDDDELLHTPLYDIAVGLESLGVTTDLVAQSVPQLVESLCR